MTSIIRALLFEPLCSLRAGASCILGKKNPFNFYDLNPQKISRLQCQKPAILLIHGNYHNQSAWLSLAKSIKKNDTGPIYTLTLPNGSISLKDYQIIINTVESIKHIYKISGCPLTKLYMVGHSRGGEIVDRIFHKDFLSDNLPKNTCSQLQAIPLKKAVKLGFVRSPIKGPFLPYEYEVTGKKDVIFKEKSHLPTDQKIEVDCGHLGLIYSSACHKQILKWLH